jgi:hypothetical protein
MQLKNSHFLFHLNKIPHMQSRSLSYLAVSAQMAFMGMVRNVKISTNARNTVLVNVMVAAVKTLGVVMNASVRGTIFI